MKTYERTNDIEKLVERCKMVVHTGDDKGDRAYDSLLETVAHEGLFKRTPLHYSLCALVAILGIAGSIYSMTIESGVVWQTLNGIAFGFWSVQLGMIGHDLSHGAVFKSRKLNRFFAMLEWCLIGGLSERRWFEKHNAHHKNPNHEAHDPDLEIPFIVDDVQIEHRSAFFKNYILPYQHILFWITLPIVYFWNIFYSLRHLFHRMDIRAYIEVGLMLIHFVLLIFVTFWLLPVVSGIAFFVSAFITIGVYMSLVFAPNHKGEDVLAEDATFLWIHQITQTRNIHPNPIVFYVMGGLNFQIEHHLFPTMSRLQYFRAQKIVKAYCKEHSLAYHETSWLQSMKDIHESLKETRL